MRRRTIKQLTTILLFAATLLAPTSFTTTTKATNVVPAVAATAQGGNVGVNGFFSVDPAQQGTTFQAAIVLEIPEGIHVNSNRPLGKYAIPTNVKIDAPKGLRITPVSYPRGTVRTFRFGEGAAPERLAVYEDRAIVRFSVGVPANFELGVARIRATVRYQSCSDEVCFPPVTRELVLPIAIVRPDTPMNRINQRYFGGGGRRRG